MPGAVEQIPDDTGERPAYEDRCSDQLSCRRWVCYRSMRRPPRCRARNRSTAWYMSIWFSGFTKPVSLVVLDHVLDLDPPRAQRLDEIVGFGLHDARVVGALDDQQRCSDLVHPGDRRAGQHVGLLLRIGRVADEQVPVVGQVGPGGRRQGPHEVRETRDADVVDRGGEDVGGEGDADQGGVAAVGAAEDRDAIADPRSPALTAQSTASIRSSCILPANSPMAALTNALP